MDGFLGMLRHRPSAHCLCLTDGIEGCNTILPCKERKIDHPLDVSGFVLGTDIWNHLHMYYDKQINPNPKVMNTTIVTWGVPYFWTNHDKPILTGQKDAKTYYYHEVQAFCGAFGATTTVVATTKAWQDVQPAVATVAFSKWDYRWSMCHHPDTSGLTRSMSGQVNRSSRASVVFFF